MSKKRYINVLLNMWLSMLLTSCCGCPFVDSPWVHLMAYTAEEIHPNVKDSTIAEPEITHNPIVSLSIIPTPEVIPCLSESKDEVIDSILIVFHAKAYAIKMPSVEKVKVVMVYDRDTVEYKSQQVNADNGDNGWRLYKNPLNLTDASYEYTLIAYCEHPKPYMKANGYSATDYMKKHSINVSGKIDDVYFSQKFVTAINTR